MPKSYLIIILLVLPITSFADQIANCGNNEQAEALAKLIQNDKDQQRTEIRCNKILIEVAIAKAKEMAELGLVMHNLGKGPNFRLRDANYQLPNYYGTSFSSNQVEAIAGGYSDAYEVWDALKGSEDHRKHLLGEHELYLEQDEMGVAFIKDLSSPHIEYWVVYLTKGSGGNQYHSKEFSEIPNKGTSILHQSDDKK